jgi:hypothetical protein
MCVSLFSFIFAISTDVEDEDNMPFCYINYKKWSFLLYPRYELHALQGYLLLRKKEL